MKKKIIEAAATADVEILQICVTIKGRRKWLFKKRKRRIDLN